MLALQRRTQVRETSRKPDEIYGLIERLSPGTRKLEIFGRPHNLQPNWITLGNQLQVRPSQGAGHCCTSAIVFITLALGGCRWLNRPPFPRSSTYGRHRTCCFHPPQGVHLEDPELIQRFEETYGSYDAGTQAVLLGGDSRSH